MTILPEDILTSDRKLEWYSLGQALRVMLLFALVPSRLQRRETCWLWYERPKTSHSRS
jgi:hypothetical protein